MGRSPLRIKDLINAEAIGHLDVLVCTHNDLDHAEGIAGLLEADCLDVGEVWLPGRWSQRIIDLCRSSEEFLDELAEQIGNVEAPDLETVAATSGAEAEASAPSERPSETESPRGDEPGSKGAPPESRGDDLEAAVLDAIDAIDDSATRVSPWHWPWFPHRLSPDRWRLWVDCLTAANRIRRIAIGARSAGARIRWFDFAEFGRLGKPSGGIPGFLVPVNAVEITPRMMKARISAFDLLRLSVANRESLVFHGPASSNDADILFSADSDLGFALPAMTAALVTAPHHGSDANAGAYSSVANFGAPVTWVRSDGRYRKRPGKEFLKVQASAYCTRCRGSTSAGQAVRFQDQPGSAGGPVWSADTRTVPCHCIP